MPQIEALDVAAYRVPTDAPESDGTACWTATTAIVVRVRAEGVEGLGYSYAHEAAAQLVDSLLRSRVEGFDAFAIDAASLRMMQATRNLGRPGLASCARSAVDAALWDLKARLLGLPLVELLGPVRSSVPLYGSGGFTSYDKATLTAQATGWAKAGIRMVKIKVGTHPDDDLARVSALCDAVGDGVTPFIDANGAYTPKQALSLGARFAALGVGWFEEPVSSDDRANLAFLRDRLPMDVAAGEYGYDPWYFRTLLETGAVDVLQADATRCGGPTGFLKAAALAEAFHRPLSAHTAPSLHVHLCCAALPVVHQEWFHDHVRLEAMLFDGAPQPVGGRLAPDRSRPGLGLSLNAKEAARFAV